MEGIPPATFEAAFNFGSPVSSGGVGETGFAWLFDLTYEPSALLQKVVLMQIELIHQSSIRNPQSEILLTSPQP
jgi:hypothetical protein